MAEYRIYPYVGEESVNIHHREYGIALYDNGCLIRVIEAVSPDRGAVLGLVALFNGEGLDPVHFDQAVEDFLYDFSV